MQYIKSLKYYGWHKYRPYNATYKNNDEIRIPVNSQDLYTVPGDSTIVIEGTIKYEKKPGATTADSLELETVNNAVAFLFDQIRYELNGVEIDRCKYVGVTSTAKVYLTCTKEEAKGLKVAGWDSPITDGKSKFYTIIPLSMFLGFASSCKDPLFRIRQELILVRSRTDKNAYRVKANGDKFEVKVSIDDMYWNMPEVKFHLGPEKMILDKIKNNESFQLRFASFETHVYPQLPLNTRETWKLMTTTNVEAPTHIIVIPQTNRMDLDSVDASKFDNLNMRSVTVKLNSQTLPVETQNENFTHGKCLNFYYAYLRFLQEFSNWEKLCEPILSFEEFKNGNSIFVVRCYYEELIKPGPLDIQLEIEANDNFPANTTLYAILIHDVTYTYQGLTGLVRKIQ